MPAKPAGITIPRNAARLKGPILVPPLGGSSSSPSSEGRESSSGGGLSFDFVFGFGVGVGFEVCFGEPPPKKMC